MKKIYFLPVLLIFVSGLFAQGGNEFFAPQHLTGEKIGDTIHVTWDEPGNGAQWIHWDSSAYYTSVGLISGGTFFAASRWTPEQLTGFENYYLSKIAFFPTSDSNAVFTLKIWQGENASTLVLSQEVETVTLGEWNEVTIDNPIQIDTQEELWFGFSVTQQAGFGVAGVDSGPALQGKGDYISLDGTSWNELPNIGYNYNWNLKGFLSFTPAAKSFVSPDIVQEQIVAPEMKENMFMLQKAMVKDPDFDYQINGKSIFQSYRLIHKIEGGAWESLGNMTDSYYNYYIAEEGIHYFMVYAVYESGESMPEGPFIIDTEGNGIAENSRVDVALYPNPATQLLHLSSPAIIRSVEIYNSTGERLQKREVNATHAQLDLTHFTEGAYWVKVFTKEGVNVQKVIVK